MNVHIVVKGDTLWKIARQYGISFEELKKVNAHLANPDYIVPGMKIFLPEGGKGAKPQMKPDSSQPPKEKMPHAEKPMKPQTPPVPPVPKPAPPKPEIKPVPKPEVKPIPKPGQKPVPKPQPKPEVKPQPKPKPPEVKPAPMPVPPSPAPEKPVCETPVPQPVPMPQPPMIQPMYIGIPCGWMPIFDADCYPHGHQYQPPAHPQPPHVQPAPMIPPTMHQEMTGPPQMNPLPESAAKPYCPQDESPVMPGTFPGMSPSECMDDRFESPIHRPPVQESSSFDLTPPAYCPPENGYVPQPVTQQPAYPMQGIQAAQHPQYMHLCTSCGSQMAPLPYYSMPPYMAPMPYMMPGMQGPVHNDQDPMGSY